MRQLATSKKGFSYPFRPRLVLLEQPWQLSRDDWSAEDPSTARRMLQELLSYSASAGIPVFSSHSSDYGFSEARAFNAEFHIPLADIRSITSRGFSLGDSAGSDSFLGSLLSAMGGPIVLGGAHARFEPNSSLGSLFAAIGLQDIQLDGLCIREPLRFLLSMRESGLFDAKIYLDPRVTLQLSGARMEISRLYEVVGMVDDALSFSIRPAMRT